MCPTRSPYTLCCPSLSRALYIEDRFMYKLKSLHSVINFPPMVSFFPRIEQVCWDYFFIYMSVWVVVNDSFVAYYVFFFKWIVQFLINGFKIFENRGRRIKTICKHLRWLDSCFLFFQRFEAHNFSDNYCFMCVVLQLYLFYSLMICGFTVITCAICHFCAHNAFLFCTKGSNWWSVSGTTYLRAVL